MKRGSSISLHDCSQRQKHCTGSVYRICDLPDSILSHILSFLPTKNAVATHILSQRWRFLWTMTNNLDLYCPYDENKIDQYVKFVNYVLLLHEPGYLNRLRIAWLRGCIPYHVNTWISAAVRRNVHELIVSVKIYKLPIQVQRCMFSCESLKSLELDCKICFSSEFVVSLPRLESLSLISVSFRSEETFCNLLGGCPVLTYLFINIDIIKTMKCCQLDIDNGIEFRCKISSDSLRHLELCAFNDSDKHIFTPVCGVQLDAPLLEYLRLVEISSICIHQSFIILVDANIELASLQTVFEDQNYFDSVVRALRTFDCVKNLTLSTQFIMALSRSTIEMKTRFNNLTRLEVKRIWMWCTLRDFITLADCLEVLIVNTGDDEGVLTFIEEETDLVPRCLSNSLKTVAIEDYVDDEAEFTMVSYVLKHGNVLEVLHIYNRDMELDTSHGMVKEICKLPRKSPVCKVEFHKGHHI